LNDSKIPDSNGDRFYEHLIVGGAIVQLTGRVCFIAGASGVIGQAVAREFLQQGARLALTFQSNLPAEFANWKDREPDRVWTLPLDIRNRLQVQQAIAEAIRRFGGLHALVNCTGVLGPVGPTAEVSAADWATAVEINLLGSFYLTRAVLPHMLEHGGGKIIHFSGGGAAYARPFYTAYSASKTALVRFVESLAEEVRRSQIEVNAIAPGPVESRMWNQMRQVREPDARTLEELKRMEETGGIPPERAAALAVVLASDRSNGLTGRLISAVHDNWAGMGSRIEEVMRSEAGTLRRVPLG
jgi:NAD(P)-dependent dehydrogenase (short-subunit alcohol dehydrogenase family)